MNPAKKESLTLIEHTEHTACAQIIPFESAHRDVRVTLANLQEIDLLVAQETLTELNVIREMHPEWHAQYEETSLETAPSEEVLQLLLTAPNSFAKGLISGVLRMRLSIASITGLAF